MTQLLIDNTEIVQTVQGFHKLRDEFLNDLKITSENVDKATDVLGYLKEQLKEIDTQRKTFTIPLRTSLDAIMEQVRQIEKPIKEEVKIVGDKILKYKQEERAAREKENQERIRLEEDHLKEKLDTALEESLGDTEDPEVVAVEAQIESLKTKPPKASTLTRGRTAKTGIQKNWAFELINIDEVPKQYLMLNEVLIGNIIKGKHGIHEIPGLRIFQRDTLTTKRS